MTTIEEKEQSIMLSMQKSQELIGKINLAELPAIIDAQVSQISELGAKIETALAAADNAKDAAQKAEAMSTGLGHKRRAIEELQKSGRQSAEAIGETVDALKLSFEYEKQLGEISKFLIALGAFSAEHTRQTVAKLKAEILAKGTGAKLNDVAKKQLTNVIAQLEVQGETIRRQEELEQEIAGQRTLLEDLDEQDEEQDVLIAEGIEKDKEQDAQISENARDIDALERQDAEQDEQIEENRSKNVEQDEQIEENRSKNIEQDEQIEENRSKNIEQDDAICTLKKEINDLKQALEKIKKLQIFA